MQLGSDNGHWPGVYLYEVDSLVLDKLTLGDVSLSTCLLRVSCDSVFGVDGRMFVWGYEPEYMDGDPVDRAGFACVITLVSAVGWDTASVPSTLLWHQLSCTCSMPLLVIVRRDAFNGMYSSWSHTSEEQRVAYCYCYYSMQDEVPPH